TLSPLNEDPTSDLTPSFSGTVTDTTIVADGIQYQLDSTNNEGWEECTAEDGGFDELSEAFTCTVASNLDLGSTHTIYVRALKEGSPSVNMASLNFSIKDILPPQVVIHPFENHES